MKKTKLIGLLFVALFIGYTTQSCQETAVVEPAISEFVADSTSFAGFTVWAQVGGTLVGPGTNLTMGAMIAHAGGDSSFTRRVFFKDNKEAVDGVYPVGTMIAKDVIDSTGLASEYFGMAKRGNGFNSLNGDWEWFRLDQNGTILKDSLGVELRGGAAMTMCNSCHAGATTDYSFAK